MSARRAWIGGSDAAAVLGISSWKTPVELWTQKVGRAANDDVSEARERMFKRGRRLEPFIRDMVIDKLRDDGHEVTLLAKNKRYRDPQFPFIRTEIDFELAVDGEEVNGDAKSVNSHARKAWGAEGTDEIPLEYTAQFMLGLGVAPGHRRRCLVAALRSFDDVDIYWVQRDDETIAAMREKLVAFWTEHVVPKVAPDPRKFADMRMLFQRDNGSSIEATPDVLALADRLRACQAEIKERQGLEEQLKFEIARYMGPHALLTNGVRDVLSWADQETRRFDSRAFKRDHRDWYELFSKTTTERVMRWAARR